MKTEGRVLKIVTPYEVVVDVGGEDGVRDVTRFLIYALGDELADPETQEPLGRLEIVRGRGEPKHIQPRFTTVRSLERKRVTRDRVRPLPPAIAAFQSTLMGRLGQSEIISEEVEATAPFEDVSVGDLVRLL